MAIPATPTDRSNRRRLAALRLEAQNIANPRLESPGDVVDHMLAMQAQDFDGALWSVGLRTRHSTQQHVLAALASAEIVRSWPLRGTLHLVPARDLGWLMSLTATRLIAGTATRRRQLELDEAVCERARDVAVERLSGGGMLSRAALLTAFSESGVDVSGQRGYHLLWYLSQTGTLVFGPPAGSEQSFALLAEWIREPRQLERDEALGEFALRYFRSHGPATINDFAWWSSLTLKDARAGLARVRDQLAEVEIENVSYFLAKCTLAAAPANTVHALPGFDEYLLGYQNRSAVISAESQNLVVPGGGMFKPTIVVDGEVLGIWRKTRSGRDIRVHAEPFEPLDDSRLHAFSRTISRYGAFLGKPARVE